MKPSSEPAGRTTLAGIIPATCLALLTLGSVSICGYADACTLPAMLIIIAIAFSLIVLYARPTLIRE